MHGLTWGQVSGSVYNGTSSQCDLVTTIERFPASRRHCLPAHSPPILARQQRWLVFHAVRSAGEGVDNDVGAWVEDRSFGGSHCHSAENLGMIAMVSGRNLAKVMDIFCY